MAKQSFLDVDQVRSEFQADMTDFKEEIVTRSDLQSLLQQQLLSVEQKVAQKYIEAMRGEVKSVVSDWNDERLRDLELVKSIQQQSLDRNDERIGATQSIVEQMEDLRVVRIKDSQAVNALKHEWASWKEEHSKDPEVVKLFQQQSLALDKKVCQQISNEVAEVQKLTDTIRNVHQGSESEKRRLDVIASTLQNVECRLDSEKASREHLESLMAMQVNSLADRFGHHVKKQSERLDRLEAGCLGEETQLGQRFTALESQLKVKAKGIEVDASPPINEVREQKEALNNLGQIVKKELLELREVFEEERRSRSNTHIKNRV
eukprot:gnl/MRDRNA2_/MRDRNA2_69555_c0_seq1.p1 gnl/MRDRNA2_/MRDRNA2_69555_c0~~gnl/MRDRNA2_/MRDRNA2_69555_c0_seq1.p1  ORF type:complete len:335 (-),score=86.91 gnl/MRDRNA2_/MRDRNA2_69555_c0_seq1:11-967(-)